MDQRVAVDLARAGHEEPRIVRQGQLQEPPCALAANSQRLEWALEIRRGRSWAGQVADGVNLGVRGQLHLLAHIGDHQREEGRIDQVSHVVPAPGGQVIEADDRVTPRYQVLAQVRPQEARPSRHDDAAHRRPIPV